MRAILGYLWRVLAASVLLTAITFGSYYLLARWQGEGLPLADAGSRLGLTFLSALLVSTVLTYLVLRSRWSGTQLMCAVFVAYFGLYTFIPQSEAMLVMAGRMALPSAALLTAQGFLGALLYSFVLVALMGRLGQRQVQAESARLHLSAGAWLWRVGLCATVGPGMDLVVRVALWPWAQPLPLPPLGHTISLLIGRSLLLIAFMLPIITMTRGGRAETALAIGLLLCVLAGVAPLTMAHLYLPGPLPPEHLIGISVANLLYGLLVGYLFSGEPRAAAGGALRQS
jgi:hypothetical protein